VKLSDREWKEFNICGKDGIFQINSTSSGIDKNKLILEDGNIPYITRTENNNGISLFIPEKQRDKYSIDEGNVITIGLDTQTVFYQPYKFYTGQNIQVLKHPKLNKNISLFIISLLKIQMEKFNWGGNGATLGRLERTKIMLPVTKEDSTKPDWKFMDDYITNQYNDKEKAYKRYLNETIKELEYNEIVSLEEKEWKEFSIEDLFNIKSGKRLTKSNMIEGNMPFIGSIDSNNGITNFVSNINNSLDKNVLGVNYNGSICETFYHPYECIFSDDVKRLSLKNVNGNKYIYLFFKSIILKQKVKYTYGYKFNGNRMKRQIILVPINNNNEPDYEYMEQYIKNCILKKCERYLSYKKVDKESRE